MSQPVQAFFEQEASRYGQHFLDRKSGRNVIFQTRMTLACEMAAHTRGAMLDCAVGTGEITTAVFQSGRYQAATVVDISGEMLRQAKARLAPEADGGPVHIVQADVFQFLQSQTDGSGFDLILCLGLIAHTGRLEELLDKLAQCLSVTGRILLQTSLLDHPGNRLWRLLMHKRATARQGYEFSYYTHKDIESAARNVRLRVLEVRRYAAGVPFVEKLSPRVNYLLEMKLWRWASEYGAEAIYALGKS
jgi:ubiquinone/menaquinone biosynthesis C-methylase UbiE